MLTPWGSLPKSQIDPLTIDEAVAVAIAAHEDDPTAHLGTGESLEQHKTNEVIDHPAYSVVDDKTITNKFSLETYFENTTCFSFFGSHFNYFGYAEIYTTTVLNNYALMYNLTDDMGGYVPDIAQNPIFEFVGFPWSAGNYLSFFGLGDFTDVYGIGFKAENSAVYATYCDTDEVWHTITLTGINPKILHKWRVEVVAGVSAKWFVDNSEVASIDLASVNIHISGGGRMFSFYVKNTASNAARFAMYRVLVQQNFISD